MLAAPAAPRMAAQVRTRAPGPDTTLVRPCGEGQARRIAMSGCMPRLEDELHSILARSQPPRQAGGVGRLPPHRHKKHTGFGAVRFHLPLFLSSFLPQRMIRVRVAWMQGFFRRKQGALHRGEAP